ERGEQQILLARPAPVDRGLADARPGRHLLDAQPCRPRLGELIERGVDDRTVGLLAARAPGTTADVLIYLICLIYLRGRRHCRMSLPSTQSSIRAARAGSGPGRLAGAIGLAPARVPGIQMPMSSAPAAAIIPETSVVTCMAATNEWSAVAA